MGGSARDGHCEVLLRPPGATGFSTAVARSASTRSRWRESAATRAPPKSPRATISPMTRRVACTRSVRGLSVATPPGRDSVAATSPGIGPPLLDFVRISAEFAAFSRFGERDSNLPTPNRGVSIGHEATVHQTRPARWSTRRHRPMGAADPIADPIAKRCETRWIVRFAPPSTPTSTTSRSSSWRCSVGAVSAPSAQARWSTSPRLGARGARGDGRGPHEVVSPRPYRALPSPARRPAPRGLRRVPLRGAGLERGERGAGAVARARVSAPELVLRAFDRGPAVAG